MGSPLVRVVLVNWNGREHTLRCIASLDRLEWPKDRLEIVVVDNGSDDGLVDLLRRERPDVGVVATGRNLGFAAGCNAAMRDLGGVDLVALVNNDAEVEPGWLRAMVDAVRADGRIGAATARVRFADRFVAVRLATPTSVGGRLDRRALGVRLELPVPGAQLGDGWWGLEHDDRGDHAWTGAEAVLWVPPARDLTLMLSVPTTRVVEISSGGRGVTVELDGTPRPVHVPLAADAVELIDNAGSELGPDLYGRDRGHLQPDGAAWDEPADVFAWFGGAALLRTDYLDDVGLFDEALFMYYEDLELSWRGRHRGWRYVYVPDAIVRHVHSASAVEGSAFAQFHGERNRLVVLAMHAAARDAARAALHFLLSTASYARRDIAAPLLARRPPRPETVRRRLRAFAGYLRLLPHALGVRLTRRRRSARRPR